MLCGISAINLTFWEEANDLTSAAAEDAILYIFIIFPLEYFIL